MVQVIVTELPVSPFVVMPEITGAGAEPVVVKVKLPEVLDWLEPLVETTSKSYVVPGVRPVKAIEWLVTRLVFKVEEEP